MSSLAAVVLAAGASTRMGRPKALIEWRGRPFVDHVVGLAEAGGCAPTIVVTGAVELPGDATRGARCVHNSRWQAGQFSSIQAGAAATRGDAAVLLLTVDRPHIRPDTVVALVEAWRAEPTGIWQPRLGDRRGHPLIVPPDVVAAVANAAAEATLRDVLAEPAFVARRRQLPCEDPAVLDNLDRPADLARLSDVVWSDPT